MGTKLFVSSLAWATKNDSLRAHFEQAGAVEDAAVITERDNPGRSRGFAFVTMANAEDAQKAIQMLDGSELDGRKIKVAEAQERERR